MVVQGVHASVSKLLFRLTWAKSSGLKNRRGTPIIQRMLTPAAPAARPPSPCINVCSLDDQGYCIGCLRTGAEIGRWLAMSAAEQWRLIAELEERRRLKR
ncbi:MAG TPA: DUF1289 domain-containing protein [Steroidobacteraceae bacterium]|nr:DUF1289 domain-containing protein [Steroidobacteraceae bacterium]